MFASIHLHSSSKVSFFMLKLPIVARRRGCQLATTALVLTPPGKPSTWFPGEELMTQGGSAQSSAFCLSVT